MVTVTPQARQMVLEALSGEPSEPGLALWVEVGGVAGGEFAYDLYFRSRAEAAPGDVVVDDDGLAVVVPRPSVDHLVGARLDCGESGLVLVNPNRPTPGPTGPLATLAAAVLADGVNPVLAAQGERAELVDMDEEAGVAYVRMSGGCQCGVASNRSVIKGIEADLRHEVPGLVRVVEVSGGASSCC